MKTNSLVVAFFPGVLAFFCVASVASAQTPCPDLRNLDSESFKAPTRILSAALVTVPAAGLPSPLPMNASKLPIEQYCAVTGYVAPQHQFEMRMPVPAQWNGKFFYSACAGLCGGVNGNACNQGLLLGYASVTSNGGHTSAPGFDGVWAANDPDAQEEYAYRGNHNVTLAAKKIVEAFYGKPPRRSYMGGCSKGGQATLMAALRYPDDFDGIVSAAPVYDLTGKGVIHASWTVQANSDGKGGVLIDGPTTERIHRAVLEACDAGDGVVDGVVGDPLSCRWKPADLACRADRGSECLTSEQVTALAKMYAAPTDANGKVLFPAGHALGAETIEWQRWVIGEGQNYRVAQQFMRYLAFEKSPGALNADPLKFDFSRDPPKLARARSVYDATSVDLRAFKARGGKILMWHGWADTSIPAGSSIDYYLRATNAFGGRAAIESFFRLFLLPGVHHCAGGAGADRANMLTLLDTWVDQGIAPDVILTTKEGDGVVTRTRPVFPYPKVARYGGTGNVEDPLTWTAVEPATMPKVAGVPWYPASPRP
jgi:hypothetical protein